MSLTGIALIVLLIAAALVLALGAAFLRVRRRTVLALVLVLVSTASGVGAALAAANRQVLMYPTWSSLVGSPPTVTGPPARGRHLIKPVVTRSGTGSAITRYSMPGPVPGLSRYVYVYTPPGYNDPHNARVRYPVIQVFNGFPGGPLTWLYRLDLGTYMDAEIAAGRMAPTVAVVAEQNVSPGKDSECVNAVHGPQLDTWLSHQVVRSVEANFRVLRSALSWGTLGYSTGGFCAANIAYRHPDSYSAAASLSGYFTPLVDRTTGDLYKGDTAAYRANDMIWKIEHQPSRVPSLPIYAAAGGGDHQGRRAVEQLLAIARPPLQVTPAVLPTGGHSMAVWDTLLAPALDWLSTHIGGPQPPAATPPARGSGRSS